MDTIIQRFIFDDEISHQRILIPITWYHNESNRLVITALLSPGQSFEPEARGDGDPMSPHSVIGIVGGRWQFQLGDQTYDYEPGDKFIVDHQELHGFIEVAEATIFTRTLQ